MHGEVLLRTFYSHEDNMQKYVCDLCGYVYDPVLGDKEANIVNGTPFEELPHNWYCPVCGAPKDNFKIVK